MPVEGERTVLDTDETGDRQDTENGILYADDFEYTNKTVDILDGKGGLTGEKEDYIQSRGGDSGAMARYPNTINGAIEDYIQSRGGDSGAMARYTNTINGAFEAYKTPDGNRVL